MATPVTVTVFSDVLCVWAYVGQARIEEVKARFDARGLTYELRQQAGAGTWQLFSHDPNGAKVELDFDPSEAP